MSDSLVSSKGQHDCPDATVAQLVAQRIRNAWVAGSSPAGSFSRNPCRIRVFLISKHNFSRPERAAFLVFSGQAPVSAVRYFLIES